MHSGCECALAYVLSLIYPFFACQRALVLDCWQFSDSAYLHQICTVIVGWDIKGWFIRATEKRSASRILLHPLFALCVLCCLAMLSFHLSFARIRTFCQLCICANNSTLSYSSCSSSLHTHPLPTTTAATTMSAAAASEPDAGFTRD